MNSCYLQIGDIRWNTAAEGPGTRTAIWLQGCSINCLHCCNPHLQAFHGGTAWESAQLAEAIVRKGQPAITLIGGEPLEQSLALERFITIFRSLAGAAADIWLFTGFSEQQITKRAQYAAVCRLCDIVIAGPYDHTQTPDPRAWIGSRNQTIQANTEQGRSFVPQWPQNTMHIDIEVRDTEVLINGWPLA